MFCFIVGMILIAPQVGFFQAAFMVVMTLLGYIWFLGAVNDTFYPNGDLRPRRRRHRRRR
jgi:hypothetical protein